MPAATPETPILNLDAVTLGDESTSAKEQQEDQHHRLDPLFFLEENLPESSNDDLQQVLDNSLKIEDGFRFDVAPVRSRQVSNDRSSGRPPIMLYLSCDVEAFSDFQCLLRKNIEFFEAADTRSVQGRNRPIQKGQVGIRCRHCHDKGSFYFPKSYATIYQAAQNLSHHVRNCRHVPEHTRRELERTKQQTSKGGKQEWGKRAKVLGVLQEEDGLYFQSPWQPSKILDEEFHRPL